MEVRVTVMKASGTETGLHVNGYYLEDGAPLSGSLEDVTHDVCELAELTLWRLAEGETLMVRVLTPN